MLVLPPSAAAATDEVAAVDSAKAGSGHYFANCTDARAAGAAPILRTQTGYRTALDRDRDGVACE